MNRKLSYTVFKQLYRHVIIFADQMTQLR